MGAMTIHTAVPTVEQLGVSGSRMMLRGLLQKCPACGSGHTHRRYFNMVVECPRCSLKFERIFGHSIGYIGLNTSVTFAFTFIVLLVGSIITQPDIPVVPMLIATFLTAVVLPVVFLPSAHTLWTAIDLLLRPLLPGEIDPRFIKVDPVEGKWANDSR